jgi:hypothetical protein
MVYRTGHISSSPLLPWDRHSFSWRLGRLLMKGHLFFILTVLTFIFGHLSGSFDIQKQDFVTQYMYISTPCKYWDRVLPSSQRSLTGPRTRHSICSPWRSQSRLCAACATTSTPKRTSAQFAATRGRGRSTSCWRAGLYRRA